VNTMNDSNTFDPARYAAKLADGIADMQFKIDMSDAANTDEWWKDVLDHTARLLKTHYTRLAVNPIPQPQAKPSEYRPIEATGAPWRSPPPPWKPQAVHSDHDAAQLALRIFALESQVSALGDWADLHYIPNEAGDYVPHNCIHDLIVEGTADAVADMQEPIERLTARIDDLQSLLLKMALKVEALEQKTPC
jgi:hypothetical protein